MRVPRPCASCAAGARVCSVASDGRVVLRSGTGFCQHAYLRVAVRLGRAPVAKMGIYTSVSTGIYSRNIWIPSNILNTFRQTGVRSSLPYPRVSRNSFKDLGRGPFLEISRKIWGGVVRASRNSDFRKISRFDPEIAWNLGLWIVWSVRLLI